MLNVFYMGFKGVRYTGVQVWPVAECDLDCCSPFN